MSPGRRLLLLLPLAACVTTPAPPPGAAEVAGAEATIRSLEEQNRLAVLHHHLQALERHWSEGLLVNAVVNRVVSRSVELDVHRRGVVRFSSFERHIEQIRLHGDVAIVMGAETVQPAGSHPQAGRTLRRRFTNVWRQEGDTWRMIARHANTIPDTMSSAARTTAVRPARSRLPHPCAR